MTDRSDIVTDSEGRWVKGQSGNPAGRPKGSKNKITKKREKVEQAIVLAAAGNIKELSELMNQCIKDAMDAPDLSFRMQNRKLVFDTFVPKAKPPKDKDEDENDNTLVIKIDTVNLGDQGVVKEAIEGQFTRGDS